VIATGVVETTRGPFTITVRERVRDQLDVELLSEGGDEIPDHFEEKRRWTYASWVPGAPSPATGAPVREVRIPGGHTLAICSGDRRVWLHDGDTGMVHPIPITTFYTMVMVHRKIRDPRIALASSLLFEQPGTCSDGDLQAAFLAYNAAHPRVRVSPEPPPPGGGFGGLMSRLFRGSSDNG
jgi:hypothetical protein